MKAIVVATAMTIVLLVLVTLAFHAHPTTQRARQMTLIYFGCVIIAVLVWFNTSIDLGFLAPSLLIESRWLDLSLMLFFFTTAFFGGVLQLYNLADRGFSLRILIDIAEADRRVVDVDWLITKYGGGRGLTWMYGKRIGGLLDTNIIRRIGEFIELTSKGERVADLFLAARRFLHLESLP